MVQMVNLMVNLMIHPYADSVKFQRLKMVPQYQPIMYSEDRVIHNLLINKFDSYFSYLRIYWVVPDGRSVTGRVHFRYFENLS